MIRFRQQRAGPGLAIDANRGISDGMKDRQQNDKSATRDSAPGEDARSAADRAADEAGRKARKEAAARGEKPKETGGPEGLEPTRYGDWEKAGRCSDF